MDTSYSKTHLMQINDQDISSVQQTTIIFQKSCPLMINPTKLQSPMIKNIPYFTNKAFL